MAILEKKTLDDIDDDVLKYLKFYEFPGTNISLKGSSQYKHMKYRSDFDILISLPREIKPADVFNNLKTIIENMEKETSIFFIELKLHCKNDKKFRVHPNDPFNYTEFEKYYGQLEFFKIDAIVNARNRLLETSCVYKIRSGEFLAKDDVMKDVEQDIVEYKAEGNYYKVLKRMFSIAVLQNNIVLCDFLMRIFNSKLGHTYEKICNMQAIKLLQEYYRDDKVALRQIKQNIRLLKIKDDALDKTLKRYQSVLSKDAKEIYDKLMKNSTFT